MSSLDWTAAAIYLASGIGSILGLVLPAPRISRGAVWGLLLGALVQFVGFATLHRLDSPPSLVGLPPALSLMAWMAVLFLLAMMWWLRLPALTAVVGPLAFLAVFFGSLGRAQPLDPAVGGAWPHAHVLLASAGLGLLGVAGLAGLFFIVEHRRLKAKRSPLSQHGLPSLEALDRVNTVALSVGFPLLTLGVLTGMVWLKGDSDVYWRGGSHEIFTLMAWLIYGGLVSVRFLGGQGARQAAASAVAGFGFLLFAVVGLRLVT